MALTKAQKSLLREARGTASLAKLDIWNIEKQDEEARASLLRIATSQMVIAEVVTQYTLLDKTGLEGFEDDCHVASVYLARRAYGTWHED